MTEFTRKKDMLVRFSDEGIRQIHVLCSRLGAQAKDIAEYLNVEVSTVYYYWRRGREDLVSEDLDSHFARFLLACKSGADAYNSEKAEKALLQIARGYEYKTRKVETSTIPVRQLRGLGIKVPEHLVEKGGVVKQVKETVSEEKVPPNVKALMFWLSNRCKDRWKMSPSGDVPKDHRHLHAFIGGVKEKGEALKASEFDDSVLEAVERTMMEGENESEG